MSKLEQEKAVRLAGRSIAPCSEAYIDNFDLSIYEGFLYYFRELLPGTGDIVDILPCFSYDVLPVSFPYEGRDIVVVDFHCIDFFADLMLCYQDLASKEKIKRLLCKYMYEIEDRMVSPFQKDICEIYQEQREMLLFDEAAAIALLQADDNLAVKSWACSVFLFTHELIHCKMHERLREETQIYKDAWEALDSPELIELIPELRDEAMRSEIYCDVCALIFLSFDDTVITDYLMETFHMTRHELICNYFFALLGGLFYSALESVRSEFIQSDLIDKDNIRVKAMKDFGLRANALVTFTIELMGNEEATAFYEQHLSELLSRMKQLTEDTLDTLNDLSHYYNP